MGLPIIPNYKIAVEVYDGTLSPQGIGISAAMLQGYVRDNDAGTSLIGTGLSDGDFVAFLKEDLYAEISHANTPYYILDPLDILYVENEPL